MKKCTNCNERPGVIHFQKIFGETGSDELLCTECAQKKALGNIQNQFPNFDFDKVLGMFENAFKPQDDEDEEDFKEENKTTYTGKPGTNQKTKKRSSRTRRGILDEYCTDLTQLARDGEIDPIIGRNDEIERVIHILNRRTKNNPVLIGEPGVGKTAVAEGLALHIIENNVPEKLKDKHVLSLDITSVTAGTMYRGMFEERMKRIAKEIEKRDDIILFIDELHMIMGAGSSMESNMDAANILKPYLARGKMQMVGATTLEEYRKIEKDSALERRFQMVQIEEPTLAETIDILKGLRSKYEEFHGITYSEEALEACAKLADRYLSERFMPDKAIDLMDEVGSQFNLSITKESNDPREKKIEELDEKEKEAASTEDYQTAMEYRQQRIRLEIALENEKKKTYEVKPFHIEHIVEQMTGIPVSKINDEDQKGLTTLLTRLESKVIGQHKAVEEVTKAIKRNRIGIRKTKKPVSFLFAGPTGVGKTELTKRIAEEVMGDKDAVIRFDMSEFMEEHTVSKLIGAPPGYVGHEDAGQLTEKIRRRPYSIILLDEIEKANKKILNLLLQLFDEGRLTDSHGKTVDFSNTIIVMTSNLGVETPKSIGLTAASEESHYEKAIHAHFAPELINRIDRIVPFSHLTQEHIIQIVDLMMEEVIEGLAEKQITLTISESAKKFLATKGYDQKFGARPLARAITTHVEDAITDLLIENRDLSTICVGANEDVSALTFETK